MTDRLEVILIVEDEPEIRRFLRSSLRAQGYGVVESSTGERGVIDAATHKSDLAIIDLALPGIDGLEVIRRIRRWSSMPILVLSARAQERSKVEALDAGADDYVTKPFGVGELLARVRVALRRASRPPSGGSLVLGNVKIDFEKHRVTRGQAEIRLTRLEFKMLAHLAKSLGLVVTHERLLSEVWGPAHVKNTHYLRVYMKQLREKLEDDPVQPRYLLTEIGLGYRLLADE
jgi:two-component system, OmpR family, KDP operon response regulator KdpE